MDKWINDPPSDSENEAFEDDKNDIFGISVEDTHRSMYDTSPQTSRKKKGSGKKKSKGKHKEIVEDYNNEEDDEEELAKVNKMKNISLHSSRYLLCCAH